MDPVAHTLFGATLAETGLRRKSAYATATLVAGANLPDIDALATVLGNDMSLYLRRGWTHGILAMLVLPALLAGTIWLWHRWRHGDDRERGPGDPRLDMRWIFGLSYLATWSHPFLDWMNTYGVRLLMPFDGRWFYGDTLFIIDPWFWLLTAAGVVLARSASYRAIAGWLVLALLATALVFFSGMVPIWVKVLWALGVAAIVGMRLRGPSDATRRNVARFGFATLILYICTVFGLARFAESTAADHKRGAPIEVQSNPIPGVPFEHRVIVVYEDAYVVIPPHGERFEVERKRPTALVEAALNADSIKGFSNWMRFPYWNVEEHDSGYTVTFRDLRYVNPGEPARGIGLAEVELDENGEVID